MVATSTTSQNMPRKTLKAMLNFLLAKGPAQVSLAHTIM